MSCRELYCTIRKVCKNFGPGDYNKLTRNCNCFTRDLCANLLQQQQSLMADFPCWTNRLPRAIVGERSSIRERVVDGDLSGVWACVADCPESAHTSTGFQRSTPLMCAAKNGRAAVCEALCSIGCSIDARDMWGWNALDYARYWEQLDCVDVILRERWRSFVGRLAHPTVHTKIKFANEDQCRRCEQKFSLFCRRHHCRRCGDSVCDTHSQGRWKLPSHPLPVRLCDQCMATVARTQEACSRVFRFLNSPELGKKDGFQRREGSGQHADEWVDVVWAG